MAQNFYKSPVSIIESGRNHVHDCKTGKKGEKLSVSTLLSPEQSKRELDGSLELEELAEKLEEQDQEESESYDLIYKKEGNQSSQIPGSVYTVEEAASDWYDGEELGEIHVEDLEIDIRELRMNAVTGETELVDSSGNSTKYNIFSSFEGTTTFTQEVGQNEYVFRYDKEKDEVRATEVGGGRDASEWGNEELEKRTKLMEKVFNDAREQLWREEANEQDIRAKDSNFDQLRPVYNEIRARIDESEQDVADIERYDHVGSTRGVDLVWDFKAAVRRAPGDSIDNYDIEENKNYPVSIERV